MSSKKLLLISILMVMILAVGLFLIIRPVGVGEAQYGRALDHGAARAVGIEAIFSQPDNFLGEEIIVTGEVGQVCATSGCWIILHENGYSLYVQFFDFTVDLPAGKKVLVQGELRIQNGVPYLAGKGLEISE